MITSPSHLWAGWSSQVGRGKGTLQLSVATLGQGRKEQLTLGSHPLPSHLWLGSALALLAGWVSLGHLCWSTPTRASWPCQLEWLPLVIQISETDVEFPLHLVISILAP